MVRHQQNYELNSWFTMSCEAMIKRFGTLGVGPELTILVREDLLKDGKAFMMDVVCIPI